MAVTLINSQLYVKIWVLRLTWHFAPQLRDFVLLVDKQAVLAWRIHQRELRLIEATVFLLFPELLSLCLDNFISSEANNLIIPFNTQTVSPFHRRLGFNIFRDLFLPALPSQLHKLWLIYRVGRLWNLVVHFIWNLS